MDPPSAEDVPLEAVEEGTYRAAEASALGLPDWAAKELAFSRKGYWRTANGSLNRALGTACWRAQGLASLAERVEALTASR